ncbi:MAG: 2-isopropylmalate synthase [Deltaproteobacteria bacterium]|nr:2-isopropylmalate synthase [Deltaproteobacteria bacterium]
MRHDDLIHDWNGSAPIAGPVELFDETLRDGLQSPSVVDPPIDDKLEILRLMDRLGVSGANVGLPGAGRRAAEDVIKIVEKIRDERLRIKPACAARTVVKDIEPIVEAQHKTGVQIEAYAFIGSSPIRFFAEDWTLERVTKHVDEAVRFATTNGLKVCLVTEDTTRSSPEILRPIFETALAAGASALCLCDTVGHATPEGVRALLGWAQAQLRQLGREDVRLDWHGHNDRGLGVANALVAAAAGAQRIHGSALGVGERVGNASMDQIIANLWLLGVHGRDVSALAEYCAKSATALGVEIPPNHPVVGRDAFRTGTGVHAAAIIKALKKGDRWLADRVYSAVPAAQFGREQEIEVGYMSGLSNIAFWFEAKGVAFDEKLASRIFERAKASDHMLSDDEIWSIVREGSRL